MHTEPNLALRFCEQLFEALEEQFSDPDVVRTRVDEIRAHAASFPEVRFCKGCVLPIVDAVATAFMARELASSRAEIRAALRCEGFSSLPQIYSPGTSQSGFSGYTWGKNRQRRDKTGRVLPEDHPGYLPCPDFGIVHAGERPLAIVGEVKFDLSKRRANTTLAERDLRYYLGIPVEPTRGWDYDFGVGIAYAAGGPGRRVVRIIRDHWQHHRFVMAVFDAPSLVA